MNLLLLKVIWFDLINSCFLICLCQVFDNLKKDQPNFAKKLIAIAGDMMDEGLGISQSDLRMLEENVHIVFHSAATIKFDEPLK